MGAHTSTGQIRNFGLRRLRTKIKKKILSVGEVQKISSVRPDTF